MLFLLSYRAMLGRLLLLRLFKTRIAAYVPSIFYYYEHPICYGGAGTAGLEPTFTALEAVALPLNYIPLLLEPRPAVASV